MNKALGMVPVGSIEDDLPFLDDIVGLAVVNGGRSQEGDAGVPMLVVVPGEELLRMRAAVLD